MNVVEKVEEEVLEVVGKAATALGDVADNVAERCALKAAKLKQHEDADAKAVAERCAAKAAAMGNGLSAGAASGSVASQPVPVEAPAVPATDPDATLGTLENPSTPPVVQPPVDNDHVAEGCEQFSQETIDANKAATEELAAADDLAQGAEEAPEAEGDATDSEPTDHPSEATGFTTD